MPKPSPFDAPFTNPAISTNEIVVLIIFFGLIYIVNNYSDSDLSDPAMMGETFDVIAKNNDGKQIHLIDLDSNLVKNIISTIDNNKKTIFILGNSQTRFRI